MLKFQLPSTHLSAAKATQRRFWHIQNRVAACTCIPVRPTTVSTSSWRAQRSLTTRVQATGNSVTTSVELLKTELRTLETERDTAISTAESCAKTATKLTEMATLLEQLALEKVRNGDAEGARTALQEKASVREALEKNADRADANYQLAALLAKRIASKQATLLSSLRQDSASGYEDTGSSSSYYTTYSSDGPKWKWQQSLEDARARLKAQEEEAAREGRMAKLSAEASIAAARERIQSQALNSVAEAQKRLRAAEYEAKSGLAAAQSRLRMQDEEVLAYVRRVMGRYRRGEYVSEEELEFAFQQLERRFTM